MTRRALIAAAALTLAASLTACGGGHSTTPATKDAAMHDHAAMPETARPDGLEARPFQGAVTSVERKSASKMTPAEIDRFERAYSYAVGKGYFDAFNDAHFDHHRNRNHGFELTAQAPPTVIVGMTPAWGLRLLPWHRSFVLEAEQMLRAALRERDRQEGRDPGEADGLFMPYWDVAHDQGVPAWLQGFQPQGGTAMVPPDVPKGHPLYGKPVGSRYDIHFGRWPGGNVAFDRLPDPAQVAGILDHDDYPGFYNAVEAGAGVVPSAVPAAKQALADLERRFPDNADLKTVVETLKRSPDEIKATIAHDPDATAKIVDAGFGVGYLATLEAAKPHPDQELIRTVKTAGAAIIAPPHVILHLWAAGVDPANPTVRGTVSNFNELTVDPLFWMIHTELDRWWFTWEQSHTGLPPLTGDDAKFEPLLPQQGAWYGGGRLYSLNDLAPTQNLPYRYAELFKA
ncbi:MAG TPA: tyrosinase family protein [Acidimicrobiia bacterium]